MRHAEFVASTTGLATFRLQAATTATAATAAGTFVQPLRDVLDALSGSGGVTGAAATTELPALDGGGGTWAVGGHVPLNAEHAVLVDAVRVTPGFFSTVGVRSSAIGGLAAFLCGLGLFGIMSYRVASRAREIGIRVALGAAARSVQWLIVREAIAVVAIGIPIGLAGFAASSKVMGSLLYQLSPTDAPTLASGVCLLALVTITAAFVPARRATRLDPAVMLRRE